MTDHDNPIDALAQQARIDTRPHDADAGDPDAVARSAANIRGWLQANKMPPMQLAAMAGVTLQALTSALADEPGPASVAVLQRCEGVIAGWKDRRNAPAGGFVMTRIVQEIAAVLALATKHSGIGVFSGPSGIGKSMALRALLRSRYPQGVLVEVNPGCSTGVGLLNAIVQAEHAARIGVRPSKTPPALAPRTMTKGNAFQAVVARLAGSSRLIVIDEADNLTTRTFAILRQLHDATGCPLVLAGRPTLHNKIGRTMQDESIGGSLVGRIAIEHRLEPRPTGGSGDTWLFTIEEVCAMLDRYRIMYSPDAARWLCALANVTAIDGQREGGALRFAVKVLELAITMSGGAEITRALLQKANGLLRGADWASLADAQASRIMTRKAAVG